MRIRTLKPEFWSSEDLCALSDFSRLFAVSLLNYSDDEGYFQAHPELIRGQLFPFEKSSARIQRALDDLSRVGFVQVATGENGRLYGRVVNFTKHQKIDRASTSKLAPFVRFDESSASPPRDIAPGTGNRDQVTGNKEQVGRSRAGTVSPTECDEPLGSRLRAVGALKHRKPSTLWSAKEYAAFRNAGLDTISDGEFAEQIGPMGDYYTADAETLAEHWRVRAGEDFRRRDLLTLLNNWPGELDRARAASHWLAKKSEAEARARG